MLLALLFLAALVVALVPVWLVGARSRLRYRIVRDVASRRWTRTDEVENETLRLEHLILYGLTKPK